MSISMSMSKSKSICMFMLYECVCVYVVSNYVNIVFESARLARLSRLVSVVIQIGPDQTRSDQIRPDQIRPAYSH